MLKKVLIVDASALIHRKYTLVLKRYGCEIIVAANGRDGLELLADNPDLDLVLLGIHMPVMDGLDFLRIVRRSNHGPVPIVLLTTEGEEEDVLHGIALGAQGFVKKNDPPYTLHKLLDRLFLWAGTPRCGTGAFPKKQNDGASPRAGYRLVV